MTVRDLLIAIRELRRDYPDVDLDSFTVVSDEGRLTSVGVTYGPGMVLPPLEGVLDLIFRDP